MTDKEKIARLKELGQKMYNAALQMTTDASYMRKATKEWWHFINCELNKKEPVSDKLGGINNAFNQDRLAMMSGAESLGVSQEEWEKIVDECIYGKGPEMVDIDDLPKEEPVNDVDAKINSQNESIRKMNSALSDMEHNRMGLADTISEDFKQFEEVYLEKEKDEIFCIYDRHAGLVDGAQWQKKQLIDKACEWLRSNVNCGLWIMDFRKNMEE